jgi:hypothetical protein
MWNCLLFIAMRYLLLGDGLLSFAVADERTDAQKYQQDHEENYEKSSQSEAMARAKPVTPAECKSSQTHTLRAETMCNGHS